MKSYFVARLDGVPADGSFPAAALRVRVDDRRSRPTAAFRVEDESRLRSCRLRHAVDREHDPHRKRFQHVHLPPGSLRLLNPRLHSAPCGAYFSIVRRRLASVTRPATCSSSASPDGLFKYPANSSSSPGTPY